MTGTIDAGLFIIVVGLALTFMLLSFKLGPILKIVAMILFFIGSLWMLSGDSVAYFQVTHDTNNNNDLNTTKYIIQNTNNSNNWLGWVFLILGIVNGFLFFMETVSSR